MNANADEKRKAGTRRLSNGAIALGLQNAQPIFKLHGLNRLAPNF